MVIFIVIGVVGMYLLHLSGFVVNGLGWWGIGGRVLKIEAIMGLFIIISVNCGCWWWWQSPML